MIIKIEGEVEVKEKGTMQIIGEEVVTIFQEGDEDNGMVMTRVIVIEIIGIVTMMVPTVIIGVEDGMAVEAKVTMTEDGDADGTLILNTPSRIIPHNTYHWVIIGPPDGRQYQYQIPQDQYPAYPQLQQHYLQRPPAQSHQATNICQLCQNQGHYDYQCQFAGDFMARTQKAFNQGCSYNHQDPHEGEWSNGDNDNNDPN